MPLKLLSSGGGSVLLTANTTASDFTVNVPAVNGNMVTTADTGSITQSMLGAGVYAGYGPAFGVYSTAAQTVTTNTWTKIQMNVKEFDTANCFDATTNYRFTPNVAGYYQINGAASITQSANYMTIGIYKNGSEFKRGQDISLSANGLYAVTVNSLLYLNGSTDYIELWLYQQAGANRTINNTNINNYFNGALMRAA